MTPFARRVGIALGSFVVAWLAAATVAIWLFGSGNFLVWVIAGVVAVIAYLVVLRRDRRAGQHQSR